MFGDKSYQVEKTKYGRFLVVRKEEGKEDFIVTSEDTEVKAKEFIKVIEERMCAD